MSIMNTSVGLAVLVRKVAGFHKDYESEFLRETIRDREDYLKSPESGLFFIMSYSFYRGRSDELSLKYEEKAKKALKIFLEKYKPLLDNSPRVDGKEDLRAKYKELEGLLKQHGVNNEDDRLLVMSLVNFIQSSSEKNMPRHLIEQIKSGNTAKAYQSLDDVWAIGPKIASLILRDVVCIYGLESCLAEEDYYFLQPVDIWVHRISRDIGLIERDSIYEGEAKDIAAKCLRLGVNPIHYNQGAWYVGSKSLQF